MSDIKEIAKEVDQPKKAADIMVLDNSTTTGMQYYLGEYEKGPSAGLKFVYPKVVNLALAAEFFTQKDKEGQVIKSGEECILDKVNGAIKTTIATKVKNTKLPDTGNDELDKAKTEEIKAANPDGVVYSIEEALAWKLGERESGLADMLDDARRELMSALLKGEMPEQKLIARIAELQARIDSRKRGSKSGDKE